MTASVLYYSSNREDEQFEQKIIENLLKNCHLPIVSVSQKPLKLGKNICIGQQDASGFNMFRQVQIGLRAIKSDFIISAEADCLYPPDYFNFRPPRLDICYRNSNLYVMPDHRDYFFHKPGGATHSQVVGRKFYIETLERLFTGAPEWSAKEKNFPKERWKQEDVFTPAELETYQTKNPVIQIKTHRSMRYYTESERVPIPKLPYWGEGKTLRPQFIQSEVWKKI